ncbi:MAG: TetR-like C-terminal domain-containing protein [Ruthenibacterium sp.]
MDKVNQLVRERVLDEWAALVGKESRLGYDYVFSFFVAGCIGLLRQWLQQGMPLAPDEMATVVEGIITKGVLALQ